MPSGKNKQPKKRPRPTNPSGGAQPATDDFGQRTSWVKAYLAALILIVAIGLPVYSNTFNVPFILDDNHNIFENPSIRLSHISPAGLKQAVTEEAGRRPLASLTFALNYYFHQYDVTGYHLFNLVIHLLTAFLVFLIARQTLILCPLTDSRASIFAALLWMVNPVHTQSVTYIVQRMNSMAAMFYLLAMVCYIQGRLNHRRGKDPRRRSLPFFIVAVLAGILGLLSKEITATLPLMIFVYEWYFFHQLDKAWFRKQVGWIIAVLIVVSVVALIYLKWKPSADFSTIYALKGFTLSQRLMTAPGVLAYYLSLLFYPSPDRLRILYDISPFISLSSPPALFSLMALIGLITMVFRLRHRHRLVSFAIIWFLATLVIETSIIPLALIFEHRTYLPSVFIFIALTVVLFQKTTARKALVVLTAAILVSGIWTWQRNAVWKDKITFWQDTALKTTRDPRPHHALGLAFKDRGNPETAISHFKEALAQDKSFKKAYNNIGMALLDLKRPAEAVVYLKQAIDLDPDYKEAFYNLGQAYNNLGQTKKAEECYARTLALNPLYEKAHNNLGLLLMDRGRSDEAIAHFERAVAIDPDYETPYNNLGIAFFQKGETDRALAYFKKALALKPGYTEAARNLARAERILEQFGPPIARLRRARQEQPDDAETARRLAAVYARAGMRDLAVDQYEQALSLDGQCLKCLNALYKLYETTRQYDRAAQILEKKARLYPDNPRILYDLARAYALDDRRQDALDALKQALAAGYADIDRIRNDPALSGLRDMDDFRKLFSDD